MIQSKWFGRLALTATLLALVVVIFGAYVRLSHAGLGCPDWPVCYGEITWPTALNEIRDANQAFPERPVEVPKAWKEQVHRHLAATLGVLILALALMASWRDSRRRWLVIISSVAAALGTVLYILNFKVTAAICSIVAIGLMIWAAWQWRKDKQTALAAGLLGLVIFQAMLGMWTVTLLLKPIIVTAHLLGGLSTLGLLWWLFLSQSPRSSETLRQNRKWLMVGLVVLIAQIFLGGWVSTNYAALACPDFPTCQQSWWPEMDLGEGFVLWRGIGVDYEGGVLDASARTAIHFVHRLGAFIVGSYLLLLGLVLLRRSDSRIPAAAIMVLVALQITLGIWNVVGGLPLIVAVGHNAGAALLLLSLIYSLNLTRRNQLD